MKTERLAKRVMLALCLLSVATVPPAQPQADAAVAGETPVAAEVRLRKLHLVRPDLIPYPIAYEVCC